MTSGFTADIHSLGHDNKEDLVLELLSLMARDEHAPEVGPLTLIRHKVQLIDKEPTIVHRFI